MGKKILIYTILAILLTAVVSYAIYLDAEKQAQKVLQQKKLKPKASDTDSVKIAPSQEYSQIKWENLVPEDWDPEAGLQDLIKDSEKQLDEQALDAWQDDDPKVQAIYQRLREVWDNAPTVASMNQQKIKLPGYIVALETTKEGLSEFLLVPYFGACIHTPPPPANQIIHVKLDKATKDFENMDAIWLYGQISINHNSSEMGTSGYFVQAAKIEAYQVEKS